MDIDSVLKEHGIGVGGSNIKDTQRLSVAINSTIMDIPINTVDINSTVVFIRFLQASIVGLYKSFVLAKITSSTNLRLELDTYDSFNNPFSVDVTIIEFNNVKSLQKIEFNLDSSAAQKIVTINSIDTNKSFCIYSFKTNDTRSDLLYSLIKPSFPTVSSLKFDYAYGLGHTINAQIIEFK